MTDDRITVTVKEFCRLSGISERMVFMMLADGRLERVKIGTHRTLILMESYHRLIASQSAGESTRGRVHGGGVVGTVVGTAKRSVINA